MATTLPKYIQNANRIITLIDAEPDHTWTKTQRELGEVLGISQPELSVLLKMLRESGHVKHGHTLVGRGRMRALILVDNTALTGMLKRAWNEADDRPLNQDERMVGAFELSGLTTAQIGLAIVRMIHKSDQEEERYTRARSELNERVAYYRDKLADEREFRIKMAQELEAVNATNAELQVEVSALRRRISATSGREALAAG